MTNNTIKHLGIVENIQGSHLSVRIVHIYVIMDNFLWGGVE